MARVNWKKTALPSTVRFIDIPVGETFRLVNGRSVYMKVEFTNYYHSRIDNIYAMLELETGDIYPGNRESQCIIIPTEINIYFDK